MDDEENAGDQRLPNANLSHCDRQNELTCLKLFNELQWISVAGFFRLASLHCSSIKAESGEPHDLAQRTKAIEFDSGMCRMRLKLFEMAIFFRHSILAKYLKLFKSSESSWKEVRVEIDQLLMDCVSLLCVSCARETLPERNSKHTARFVMATHIACIIFFRRVFWPGIFSFGLPV